MEAKDYSAVVELDIHVPTEKVWDGLTNPVVVKQYLHGTNLVSDWQVGSPITWHGEWDGKSYEDKGTILAVEQNKLLKVTHWSPLSGTEDKPENYHTLTYELAPVGDNATHLVLTQSNNPSQEAADAMAENGWKPILTALKTLLEQ